MKGSYFIIFFSIFFVIYTTVNFYIFLRGWQSIPKVTWLRIFYPAAFTIISFSYIIGRIIERFYICKMSNILIWIGSFWIALMLYLFLSVILIDLIRFTNNLFHFFSLSSSNYKKIKQITALGVIIFVSIIVFSGYINTLYPEIKRLKIKISKDVKSLNTLNIILVTDIHLGIIINQSRLKQLVEQINRINPDLVLLAGDIVDEDLAPVIENNLGETLINIKSKFGTYAVTGNHEYIGGVEAAYKYLCQHNIRVLRDEVVQVHNSFYIVGREDRSIKAFTGKSRKSLSYLMKDINKRLPIILMDHQPFYLKDSVKNSIDLHLSGHTHHGQLWPLNYVSNIIFEISRGYKKINKTHFYVSNGYGTWGPPVRIGSRPEIVNIMISFL